MTGCEELRCVMKADEVNIISVFLSINITFGPEDKAPYPYSVNTFPHGPSFVQCPSKRIIIHSTAIRK